MFPLCTALVVMFWPTYLILLPSDACSNVAKLPLRDETNLKWESPAIGQLHNKTLLWLSKTCKSIRTDQ